MPGPHWTRKILIVCLCLAFTASIGLAQSPAPNISEQATKLAAESEAYCVTTAANGKPTPQDIMDKVNQACSLLEKEGSLAFTKFLGKDSPFIFKGTYLWIHNMEGIMVLHPIKPTLIGKMQINMKDKNGKLFFVAMNKLALEKGEGWVSYVWERPGKKGEYGLRTSYIKKCKTSDGKMLVVGCGDFDLEKPLEAMGVKPM
ncbi:MAG: cache domain-containing protein [Deltaproteobacteria bacterium]|nr:cache domain-containing protein [Deltaproteobacteria bacterium]